MMSHRVIGCFLLCLAVLLLFAACDLSNSLPERLRDLQNAGEVRVGTAITAPFVTRNAQGELVGFDVDLMRAIVGKLGVRVSWQEMAFADLLPQLQRGCLDMVVAAMYITEEREALVDFSQAIARRAWC